ncbi:hypothetical protein C7C46_13150 [Streptomyces tateyamensis]|uniref:PH domain-containing protein n=1 Tax=Streptomyces tateyamensis TaxID=565073 RepID=A0A2V4NA80_9ACTN|nr:hypothetical protein [Streptomyces tateyamensis]AXG25760.1 hypothetical protein [Streptomyces tateyamensis]PYC80230.1 hypothetical protein C7C46_13150 [Streptomyces tateyamensis]
MQPIGLPGVDSSPVELRPSNGLPLAFAVPLAAAGGVHAAFRVLRPTQAIQFVFDGVTLGLFAVLGVLGLVALVRRRRAGWWLRLDTAGLTVHGHARVPWSDLSAVRLVTRSPKSHRQVLAFVPRPGVVLPPLPVSWPLSRPHARARALIKRYGTPIVVDPLVMRTTTQRLTADVRRLSGMPISA